MTRVDVSGVWSSFAHDPRLPEHAALRASDRDRSVVQDVLAEAYADGRLDPADLEERSARASGLRTLGEVPPLLADLLPQRPVLEVAGPGVPAGRPGALTPAQIHARAVAAYDAERRQALLGFLGPTLVCWVVWASLGLGGPGFDPAFPWPAIVMAATFVNYARVLLTREETVASVTRKLERKQAHLP